MLGAVNTAISGLQASQVRLANSASNVANMNSTVSRVDGERVAQPYRPMEVVQSSQSTGGVRTDLRPTDPSSVPVYDPNNIAADAEGITQYPNVNLESEIVGQQMAKYDFQANLKSLNAADEMMGSLLDIFA